MDDSEKSICFIDKLVWLSGQCSPGRKREMQVITQQCGVLIEIPSLISVGRKKN